MRSKKEKDLGKLDLFITWNKNTTPYFNQRTLRMDIKALLAKCISLLYRESQTSDDSSESKKLVSDLLHTIRLNNNDTSGVDNILNELKNVLLGMIDRETAIPYNDLIQHIKIACGYDNVLFESIQDNIAYTISEDEARRTILSYRFEINKFLRNKKALDVLDKMTFDLKFNKDRIGDVNSYMASKLNDIQELISKTDDDIPGMEIELEIGNENGDNIAEVFKNAKEESDGSRIIKTPWQALNRMTRGGLRLGHLTTVAGLAHNNKSGFCRDLFIGACVFNEPAKLMKDPSKKPLNFLISLEDSEEIVFMYYYERLKANFDGVFLTDEQKSMLDPQEAKRYVIEKLVQTGYNFMVLVVKNPSELNYLDIQNKILQLESRGYEIHFCLIDYLNLISKSRLSNERADAAIQELFRRTKGFFAQHDISLLIPHQLSTEANELKRQGTKMLTKVIADGSYYEGCKGLAREPELEIFVDIVKENGKTYQTVARGKHRGQNNTPEQDKFFILEFDKNLGLKWDIHGQDVSLSRFGANRNDEGNEEMAFYDVT